MKGMLFDLEAERALLGTMLADNGVIDAVGIEPDEFYRTAYGVVWQTGMEMYRDERPVDIVTLCAELTKRGKMAEVGGAAEIAILPDMPASIAQHYADIIRELAVRRKIAEGCQRLAAMATNRETELMDMEVGAGALLTKIQAGQASGGTIGAPALSAKCLAAIRTKVEARLYTGFVGLDSNGLSPEKVGLSVIGAYSKVGKSTYCAALADNIAATTDGHNVLYIGTEEAELPLGQRIIARYTGIPLVRLRKAMLYAGEDEIVDTAAARLGRLRLRARYMGGKPVGEIIALINGSIREYGTDVVFVDHIQRIPGKGDKRYVIDDAVMRLTDLANARGIAVIAASQLNRYWDGLKEDGRVPPMPGTSAIKESSAILENASVVHLLHRPRRYSEDEDPTVAWVNVCANRFGETGPIRMDWIQGPTIIDHGGMRP